MPTVLRVRGYRFYFFAEEGSEPPHVHVDKGSGTLKLWLVDLSMAYHEGLKAADIRAIVDIARENRALLIEAWNEFERRKN